MCNFCDNLNYDTKNKIIWCVRSRYADDNLYEFLEENNDYKYLENECWFEIKGHTINENTYVGIEYHQIFYGSKTGEIKVLPFSEHVQFNYCPMCGKQISKTIKEFTGDGYNLFLMENE